MRIHTLDGSKPHPGWGGWRKFLDKQCDLRGVKKGVMYYGVTNCNYILFPDGLLVKNHGYHGLALMSRIETEGVAKVESDIVGWHKYLRAMMAKLRMA